jgi:zinc/manganese transport system permease protein
MLLPFLECIVLVGIHSYLGLHVLRRQVIFVDLSIAQMAGLGTAAALLVGFHPGSLPAYLYSLSFALFGAFLFSATRLKHASGVPQEAVIGLVYAVAAAASFLLLDRAATGTEHLKDILTGNLLWVRKQEVIEAAAIYSVVGLVHFLFRRRFLEVSDDPEGAAARGVNVFLWDLLFYATFAVVITTSVEVAGVLLVFTFLVTPAIMAMLTTRSFGRQLVFGWTTGVLVSLLGLWLSFVFDLPSGPSVIVTYAAALVLWSAVLVLRGERDRVRLAFRMASHLGVAAAFIGWLYLIAEVFHHEH